MAAGKWCPLIRKNCVEHKCAFYTHVMGHNPNTGQAVDEWACSIQFLPMLLIENSQQQRGTGAAVESFRNEMVKRMDMPLAPESPKIENINITNLLED